MAYIKIRSYIPFTFPPNKLNAWYWEVCTACPCVVFIYAFRMACRVVYSQPEPCVKEGVSLHSKQKPAFKRTTRHCSVSVMEAYSPGNSLHTLSRFTKDEYRRQRSL